MSTKTSESAVGRAPRYAEIEKVLRQRILADYYSVSGFLPQERELAQEFQVSRNTLRSALQLLSDQQLISKVQGCGTMIRRPVENLGNILFCIPAALICPVLSSPFCMRLTVVPASFPVSLFTRVWIISMILN